MNRTRSSFQTCHSQLTANPTHELITLSHHYPLEARLLSNGRQGMNPDGRGGEEELGRVQGGETTIRIYFMKNKPIFN